MTKFILALGATALLAGCATISKGKEHHIMFTSTPSAAVAVFEDGHTCFTPCSRKVNRQDDIVGKISYKDQVEDVFVKRGYQRDTARNLTGNVLFFGWVGLFFDLLSGKNMGPETNHVHVNFIQ